MPIAAPLEPVIPKMALWIELERCAIKLDNCLSINFGHFSPSSVSETRIRTHYLLIVKFLSCHSTTSSNQLLFFLVLAKNFSQQQNLFLIHSRLFRKANHKFDHLSRDDICVTFFEGTERNLNGLRLSHFQLFFVTTSTFQFSLVKEVS